MSTELALAKVVRWAEKQTETWTKQKAWQANKGGTLKASHDLDSILGALLSEGLIEPQASIGRRSPRYRSRITVSDKASPPVETKQQVDSLKKSREFTAIPGPIEPEPCDRLTISGSHSNTSDADLLALAAKRRRWDGRIDHDLEMIESRHDWKRAGDTLKASDLSIHDRFDIVNIRKWLGTEPSFRDRYLRVAEQLQQIPLGSPLLARVRLITDVVRVRNSVPIGGSLPMGCFRLEEVAKLEMLLDGTV